MTRAATVLCCALLLQLTSAEDVASEMPSSDPKGNQCLMQKTHLMSRSDILDDKPKSSESSEHAFASKDASKPTTQHSAKKEESTATTKEVSEKQVKAAVAKTEPRPKPSGGKGGRGKGESLLEKSQPRPKPSGGKGRRGKGKSLLEKSQPRPKPSGGKGGRGKGKSLLQMRGRVRKSRKKKHFKTTSHKKTGPAGLMQVGSARRQNPALDLLPEPVKQLAFKLFKEENAIAGCIENSVLVDVTYAGEKMQLRMNKFDDASKRLGEEAQWFGYDLDTLNDVVDGSDSMLNMLDVGGNYGVVTIAAMKKYAKKMRVVAVEPIPETFFFLTWNLYLNGIPVLDEATLKDDKHASGVLALNSGSADVGDEDLHFCAYPWASMNSKVCDCQRGQDNCHIVPSTSVDNLVGKFGSDPIAMVKMDCEGCEFKSLPALEKPEISKRVRRLAGELHLPDKDLEHIACRWDNGRLLSKCQKGGGGDVECGVKLACPL